MPSALFSAVGFLDPEQLIRTFGTIGVIAIIFAETGILIGAILPGDSLLLTAGILSSRGTLNFPALLIGCFIAAIAGDQVGYTFGKRVGPSVFKRPDSRFFKQENVVHAREFFDNYGPITIVAARFVPFARTFTPVLAGVSGMRRRTFFAYNVIGAGLWAVGVLSIGYFIGSTVPNADKYLLPLVLGAVLLSLLPGLYIERRRRQGKVATIDGDIDTMSEIIGAGADAIADVVDTTTHTGSLPADRSNKAP